MPIAQVLEIVDGEPTTAAVRALKAAQAPLAELDPFTSMKAAVLEQFERAYVLWALRLAKGNVSEAARRAGLDRANFRRMMKKFGRTAADVVKE